jgi:hypothetical protein
MDGLSTWTDGLMEEVMQLLVDQQLNEYFEVSIYETEDCKNGLQYLVTDDGCAWTWEDEEE